MHIVGLTGGIGSGKTSVSTMLRDLGYQVIDADAITREVQAPGQPTLAAIIEAFGAEVLQEDGTLDRAALAARVFSDPQQLAVLNAIVHPAVGAEIDRRLDEHRPTDAVVVLDVPLLVESGRDDLELLIVVDVEPEVAVRRLVDHRGFAESDARARIANQVDRQARLAKADVVIDNTGSPDDLARAVAQLHHHLTSLRR
jgi:dephospho-CoA kinase